MSEPITCPRCGAVASGNFCSNCGTTLKAAPCVACGAELAPGASFCHRCGAAVGTAPNVARVQPTPAMQSRTPWIIAGVLVAVVIAGVVYTARKSAPAAAPSMANAGNAVPGSGTAGRAPPLDNMTPREQFSRLNDRIMAAAESGDTTTVFTFWPMAQGAYQNLSGADRDVDARYHMATLYLLFGRFPEALALADSILTQSPNNLFGYYLRATIATDQGDSTKARAARAAFKAHYDAEIAKKLPEYTQHELILKDYLKPGGTP